MQPVDGAAARRGLRQRLEAARAAALARPDRSRPVYNPLFGVDGDAGRGAPLLSLAAVYRVLGDRAAAQPLLSAAFREAQATREPGLRAWRLHNVANERRRAGDKSEAQRLFAEAVRVAEAIPAATVRAALLPHFAQDLRTIYRDTVQSRALARRALASAQALRGGFEKEWAVEAVVEEMAWAGDLARALPVARAQDAMRQGGLLGQLVDVCLEKGDFAGADQVIAAFPQGHFERARALKALCIRQALAGNAAGALAAAERIYEASEWLEALCAASDALVDAGKPQGTERFLARAEEIAAAVEADPAADTNALLTLAAAQRKAGARDSAARTLQRVERLAEKKDGWPATSLWAAVAKARSQGGDAAGAARCLEKAGQALEKSGDAEGRLEGLIALAQAQQAAGDRGSARKTLREALPMLPKLSHGDRALRIGDLAETQAALGDFDGAIQLRRTHHRMDAWEVHPLLAAQARAGDIEGALRNAKYLRAQDRAQALSQIARERVDAKDWAGARKALEATTAPAERYEVMAHLAGGLAQARDLPGALRVADRIGDLETRIKVLERIARSLMQAVQ